jgi:hypothetical protein
MSLPVLVNSLFLFPSGGTPSGRTAGLVPVPVPPNLLYIDLGNNNPSGLATADAFGGYTPPVASGFLVGGICYDGSNVWTGQMDNGINPPFTEQSQFTQWDDATLMPLASVDIPSTLGNGSVPCDVVVWNFKVWMLANTTGTGPAQLVANDLTTIPMLPFAAVSDFSRLLSANGHLYYFDTEYVGSVGTIFLIVDGATKIATSLPVPSPPASVPINGVAGVAWDGTNMWVTIPTSSAIAKVAPDGTVLNIYTANVPEACRAIAVDFNHNVWVGNATSTGPALPIVLALFDLNGNFLTSFGYGFDTAGIFNIVSDSNTGSVWVSYFNGSPTRQLDQYQFPAPANGGAWEGTHVGFWGSGHVGGGTK